MKIHVEIQDDDGKVLHTHDADASTPSRWTTPAGSRLLSKMPKNASDVENNGTYELFGITFQPIVRVDRPNGWTAPVPGASPVNGQPVALPMGFPTSFQKPAQPGAKPLSMWGSSSPTPTPTTAQQWTGFPSTRG